MRSHVVEPLSPGELDRTVKVDLAIARHQKLNRLDPAMILNERAAFVDELVGQIIDGVAQNLQSMARL